MDSMQSDFERREICIGSHVGYQAHFRITPNTISENRWNFLRENLWKYKISISNFNLGLFISRGRWCTDLNIFITSTITVVVYKAEKLTSLRLLVIMAWQDEKKNDVSKKLYTSKHTLLYRLPLEWFEESIVICQKENVYKLNSDSCLGILEFQPKNEIKLRAIFWAPT